MCLKYTYVTSACVLADVVCMFFNRGINSAFKGRFSFDCIVTCLVLDFTIGFNLAGGGFPGDAGKFVFIACSAVGLNTGVPGRVTVFLCKFKYQNI